MPNPKIRPKMTLSEIAIEFGFTTRNGPHERADLNYLLFSLQPYRKTLITRFKTDVWAWGKRKPLPYTVICFIFSKFQS
ncbi:hypothetical protein SAMN04515674_101459 [Pseudarcicella hirudinis]|uniref:Uncharacterized protein n=1 Tax=Pseudarcicella hirudinis TaxID=1079859 RepID=A0A1I5MW59_9BACT|nr:hypothetical protein SAMN04515674_101459 [Pseudarcicella hirudinis]